MVPFCTLLALTACRSAAETADKPQPAAQPAAHTAPTALPGMTMLPDGSYIPNLNGVKEAMVWKGEDFSPIKGIQANDQGVEWWVHENGMMSTTVVLEGTVNGVAGRYPALQIARPLRGTKEEQKPKR